MEKKRLETMGPEAMRALGRQWGTDAAVSGRGRSGRALRELAASADGQKLGGLVDAQAAERALKSGDAAALREALGRVLATDEGKRLAESVRKLMER